MKTRAEVNVLVNTMCGLRRRGKWTTQYDAVEKLVRAAEIAVAERCYVAAINNPDWWAAQIRDLITELRSRP